MSSGQLDPNEYYCWPLDTSSRGVHLKTKDGLLQTEDVYLETKDDLLTTEDNGK